MEQQEILNFIDLFPNHLKQNFCGVHPSNKIVDFAECASNLNGKKLPFAIFNTDFSSGEGTHWFFIIRLQSLDVNQIELFLFDSFGMLGLSEFILKGANTSSFFKRIGGALNSKDDPILFDSYQFNPKNYMRAVNSKNFSDTGLGMFTLFAAIHQSQENERKGTKPYVHVHCVNDALQSLSSQFCGLFCLKLLHVIYEDNIQSLVSQKMFDKSLMETCIQYVFNEGSLSGSFINSIKLSEFAEEYNIKLLFDKEKAIKDEASSTFEKEKHQ